MEEPEGASAPWDGCWMQAQHQGWLDPTSSSRASVSLYVMSQSGDIWWPPGWNNNIGVPPDGSCFPPACHSV